MHKDKYDKLYEKMEKFQEAKNKNISNAISDLQILLKKMDDAEDEVVGVESFLQGAVEDGVPAGKILAEMEKFARDFSDLEKRANRLLGLIKRSSK